MSIDIQLSADHKYTINGRPVPSVTQVLGDVLPGWQASEWYMQRGTAVHACAALIAQGKTFRNDPQIDGQVSACRRFFREIRPAVRLVEYRVASVRHGYAGTLDLVAEVGSWLAVLDWKASIGPAARYQVTAYALALEEMDGRGPRWGCAVELREDGTYRMSEVWDTRRLRAGWLAIVGAYRVRRECGIPERGEG
jgi:hypothetical protein